MPSKYRKLEQSFGGFMIKILVRFEYEKSPFHTIVYGATGTGESYFVRQYLKLNQNEQDPKNQKKIIIVCKDDRDRINPETGEPYDQFNMCDKNLITS